MPMNTNIILKRPVHVSHEARQEKEAVRRLLTFERFCRDNNLWDEMRTCYTQDSYIESSWFKGNGMEFIDRLSQRQGRAPHHIHSILVWTHGNRSVSIMETTMQIQDTINGVPVMLEADCQLLYRLVRINGEWNVQEWRTIYEQDHIQPAYPAEAVHMDPAEMAQFRPACQCLAYLQKRAGINIYQDLPGHDRPETIERLYEEADTWLQHG